ncbi:MAG: recombination mediator RecR [bacterium]
MIPSARSLAQLVGELARLPGIGKKTAQRLAFHILRLPREDALALSTAIVDVKDRIRYCDSCGNFTEDAVCEICLDTNRDQTLLCVVEQPTDLFAIEGSHEYRGLYHVLHGTLSPLDGARPETLRIAEMLATTKNRPVREVIIATNPTVEGDATAFYLARQLRPLGVRVSRIARGIPMGGDLEFSDHATLARAISGRAEIE